ncbi:hypothetical protein MUO83_10625 [Candidatus Bathyarchaeota archaeon]|jgi:hypothetical protein|nr:hypothetical protein [Candidatus Bathyarchaeota archaeon]
MNHSRKVLIAILVGTSLAASFLAWRNITSSIDFADLKTVLTTTTAAFGSLLGIITAGLMFTHGKFSELASELSEKSLDYLSGTLTLEKVQTIGNNLLALRKTFSLLETQTTVEEEKNLYRRVVEKTSSTYVNLAVLSDLKLMQQGLAETDLMISAMDPQLYVNYKEERNQVKKEWQILVTIKQMVDTWESSQTRVLEKYEKRTSLQQDLRNSISLLGLKERLDKDSKHVRAETEEIYNELAEDIDKVGKQLHQDRIPQLLSQMENANTIRGKYFYLALAFIATPLFINLLILPQLSIGTASFFQPIISITSSLSVMGIAFLLLYINRILDV